MAILVVGKQAIAEALGLSRRTVENNFINRPDFPASQLARSGQWVSTTKALEEWAERFVKKQRSQEDING